MEGVAVILLSGKSQYSELQGCEFVGYKCSCLTQKVINS